MFREIPKFKPEEILVYLRKSRSDDPSLTVEEVLKKHETILKEWIERNLDAPIPEENWRRELVSGETMADRPEFQDILKRMESPKIKAILVVEVQRLSRGDLEDCGRLMKLLRYTFTKVITPHMIYDLEDEYDRDVFERELKRGNEYLEYIKKIQKRGIRLSFQEGNYVGAIAPYGYDKTKIVVNKRKCPTLTINKDEARVVKMIFDWYGNEGVGAVTICHRLNDMGIPTRSGKRWTRATIQTILGNEHYIGKVRFYYRIASHSVIDQEIIKGTTRNDDYSLCDGKHDSIIDEELFYKVQDKRNRKPKNKISAPLQNPLASILRCQCGSYMKYVTFRNKKRYCCDAQKYCNTSGCEAQELISAVCTSLKESIDDITVLANNTDDGLIEQHQEHVAFLERRIAELEDKELSIWEKYSENGMPESIFNKLKTKCEEDKKAVEKALEQAYSEMPAKVDYEEKIIRLHETIDALNDDSVPAIAKNQLIKTVVEKIDYSRKPSVRIPKEEAERLGITTVNGWLSHDIELDIHLLI